MTAASTEPRRINDVVVNEGEGRTDLSLCAVLNPSDLYPRNGRIIVGTLAGGDAEFCFSCSPETAVGLARELVDLANEVAKVVPIDGAHDHPHAVISSIGPPWLTDAAEALCGKNPDGSVPALNWTQVIQGIAELRRLVDSARKWRETAHGGHRSWAIADREDAELVSAIDAHFMKEKS